MNPWTALVEAIEAVILAVGQAMGGTALGIFVVTFGARVLLIPVMLPMAVRTRERMKVVRRIRPEIKELNQRFKKDPHRLERELKALHEAHGIKMMDIPALVSALVQLPILIALFQAVYYISENTELASGGLVIGLVAAGLSVAGTKLSGQGEGAAWLLWLSGLLPIGIAAWLGRGIALYLAAFYAGSFIQGLLMRDSSAEPSRPQSPDEADRGPSEDELLA